MLNIAEIFRSIEGECNPWGQGVLTTFVRFQGCNLFNSESQCGYCDTQHAQNPSIVKNELSIEDILKIISEGKVTISGGEPLLQGDETKDLIQALLETGHKVSVETNGSIIVPKIQHPYLSWIIDYKLHAPHKMYLDNLWRTTSRDWIKFVIEDLATFQMAVSIAQSLISGNCKARIALSPVMQGNNTGQAQWLAEKIIEEKLWDITLNLQIHKLIWPNKPEGISLL